MLPEKTRISLNDVRLYAFHGVLPQERKTGAWYRVTLEVDYPFSPAMASDDIADTASYAGMLDIIKREMAVPSRLLEHVAGRILSALFETFPLSAGAEIKIVKENPPVGCDTGGACVLLRAKNDKEGAENPAIAAK